MKSKLIAYTWYLVSESSLAFLLPKFRRKRIAAPPCNRSDYWLQVSATIEESEWLIFVADRNEESLPQSFVQITTQLYSYFCLHSILCMPILLPFYIGLGFCNESFSSSITDVVGILVYNLLNGFCGQNIYSYASLHNRAYLRNYHVVQCSERISGHGVNRLEKKYTVVLHWPYIILLANWKTE